MSRERAAPKTTTYGIVARAAPLAVILRRGPTRHTRLLCWDLRDDTVRGGQWLVGRVDPGPCGLSPSGDLFVYEARKGPRTFTAICRPPFFTALAFWEYSAPWTGGGFFASDTTVVLGLTFENPRAAADFPAGFHVTDVFRYFANGGRAPERIAEVAAADPIARQGWSRRAPSVFHKPNPVRSRIRLERASTKRETTTTYTIIEDAPSPNGGAKRHELGGVDWADWGPDGTLLFGRAGRLYRQPLPRSLTKTFDTPRLVTDLTNQSFERIVAPDEARHWPTSANVKASRKHA
jgi:hypothetical protein